MAGNNYKLYDDGGCGGGGVGGFGWGDIEEEIGAIRSIVGDQSTGGGSLRPDNGREHDANRLPVASAGANLVKEITNSNSVGNQSGDNGNYLPVAERVPGANQRPVTRSMEGSAGDNGVGETGPDALTDISTPGTISHKPTIVAPKDLCAQCPEQRFCKYCKEPFDPLGDLEDFGTCGKCVQPSVAKARKRGG